MTVVEELRQNRESGAKRLESEYKAGLMTLARRFCPDEGDAEELVNRTFAAVVNGIDDYLEQSAFFGWMCQILSNIHSMDVRRKSHSMETTDGEAIASAADEDAGLRIFQNVDASLLRDAIRRLTPEMEQAVVMHYLMGLSTKQVAKFLALPVSTIHWRLRCARAELARRLGVAADKAREAAKKPGCKATLIALAICTLMAAGAGARHAVVRLLSSPQVATEQQADGGKDAGHATSDMEQAEACAASSTSSTFSPSSTSLGEQNMNISKNTPSAVFLLAAGLSLGAQGAIVDEDTLVFVSSDIEPVARTEMNDLRAAGDTSKPAVTLYWTSPGPTQTSDAAFSNLFAGYNGLAEKIVNTNVLCFAGGNAVLQMSDRTYLNDDFTFEFFYRTESDSMADHFDDGKTAAYLAIQHMNWYFRINKNTGTITYYDGVQETTTPDSYADGKWHHFAVVWRKVSSKIKIFIDYSLKSERDLSTSSHGALPRDNYTEGGGGLLIGRGPWNGNYQWVKRGRYDGIRLTRRALAPMEFLSSRIYPVDADTLAYMSFDSYAAARSGKYDVLLNANALSCAIRTRGVAYDTNETVFAASLFHAARANDSFDDSQSIAVSITASGNGEAGFGYVFDDPDHLVGTTNFTAEVFAKFIAAPSPNYGYVFNQPNVWRLFLTSQGQLGCSVKGTTTNHLGTDSLVDNNWHHLAAVYDAGRQTFSYYLDYKLFWRFDDVANPLKDGASNPEKLLFGGFDHDAYNMQGSVNGVLYDELRITGRALKVSEFLTDVSLVGADPVFHVRFENSFADFAPTGRYAPEVTAPAGGAEPARDARVSQNIIDSRKAPLFANAAGLALTGGAVSYSAGGILDLDAATAECFVRRTGGGAGDILVAFAPDGDLSSAIWSLAANGTVSVTTDEETAALAVDLSDGAWHHFALSWSQDAATTTVQVWRDHVPVGSTTLAGTFDFGSGAGFVLGSAGASGAVDELRLREGVLGTDGMLYAAPQPATVIYMR